MKIEKLIALLQELPQDSEIMILDGFNGDGYPRTINIPPALHEITDNDQQECADCEELLRGSYVYVIGYGSY